MRMTLFLLLFSLCGSVVAAEPQALKSADGYTCSWGAGTAARAQQLKLSGISLYAARQKIQAYSFDKSWKRLLAMRITEQTYDSKSRYKPEAVRALFYKECVKYKTVGSRVADPRHRALVGS